MSLRKTLIAIVPAVAMATLVLLTVALITIRSTSAQSTDTPTCSTSAAVPDPDNNPGLVSDCEALLASRDTLAGDASLNWSADVSIAQWEGVTVGGTPLRVTELRLREKVLTGQLPAELASLSQLKVLDFRENELAGEIPADLGRLGKLEILDLQINQLTGEIPADLGSLNPNPPKEWVGSAF